MARRRLMRYAVVGDDNTIIPHELAKAMGLKVKRVLKQDVSPEEIAHRILNLSGRDMAKIRDSLRQDSPTRKDCNHD